MAEQEDAARSGEAEEPVQASAAEVADAISEPAAEFEPAPAVAAEAAAEPEPEAEPATVESVIEAAAEPAVAAEPAEGPTASEVDDAPPAEAPEAEALEAEAPEAEAPDPAGRGVERSSAPVADAASGSPEGADETERVEA
jgi:hypothetical protein